MVSWKIFDNDLTILSICSDFCDAKNQWYFDINRKKYNVAFLPSCHRLYTWRLLAAWYHLLWSSKNKNLSLIYLWKKVILLKYILEILILCEKFGNLMIYFLEILI